MSKKTVGVGSICLGWMGRLHARGYRALAEKYAEVDTKMRLVSACDPVESNRIDAVESQGFERAIGDCSEPGHSCSRGFGGMKSVEA